MYEKVSTNMNFVEREKKIEKFWKDENIFEKSIESRKKGTPYVFYDGPPTACLLYTSTLQLCGKKPSDENLYGKYYHSAGIYGNPDL